VKKFICIPSLLVFLLACSKPETVNQCVYDPCALVAPAAEITNIENYLAANSATATKHCSGVFYAIDVAGTGSNPNICSTVTVKYKGWLTSNGSVFDQSSTPVSFALSSLIEGWKKGIMLLKPGGKIRMWIPPTLAYGNQDSRNNSGVIVIPANSTLYFEVELVATN